MERFRTRLIVGTALMGVGFIAVFVMMLGFVFPQRPPSWIWAMVLWIGAGAGVVVSAFVSAATDRRRRTAQALRAEPGPNVGG